jgi:hypothetical protein
LYWQSLSLEHRTGSIECSQYRLPMQAVGADGFVTESEFGASLPDSSHFRADSPDLMHADRVKKLI